MRLMTAAGMNTAIGHDPLEEKEEDALENDQEVEIEDHVLGVVDTEEDIDLESVDVNLFFYYYFYVIFYFYIIIYILIFYYCYILYFYY